MVIKSSGSLSISEIVAEFGGTVPHSLSEYYRGGGLVPNIPQNTNIPTSGSISISDFYGAERIFIFTITQNLLQVNLRTYLISNGWNGTDRATITLAPNTYLWSDDTSVAGLTTGSFPGGLTFTNNGFIIGKGGTGGLGGGTAAAGVRKNGLPGGPALSAGANFTLINNGYVAGGGGGGAAGTSRNDSGELVGSGAGGGAGGGRGGSGSSRLGDGITVESNFLYAGGAGGAIGQVGSDGVGGESILGGSGGGAGGSGAAFNQQDKETDDFGGGGGGGRILPGTGGVSSQGAGNGGSANNPGVDSGGTFGAGGGGWGARGGNSTSGFSGGAGGAAIARNGFTVTISSGSERIYGVIA